MRKISYHYKNFLTIFELKKAASTHSVYQINQNLLYLKIKVMVGQSLDYIIIDKNSYCVVDGNIDSIFQKNSQGFFVCSNQQNLKLTLDLKLKNKSIIQAFEIKTLSKNKFTFELIGEQNVVHQTMIHSFNEQQQMSIVEAKQSYERRKETNKVKIEVQCLQDTNGIIGLAYILVRGEKCQEETKIKNISRGPRQNDELYEPKIQKQFKSGTPKIKEKKQDNGSARKRDKQNKIQINSDGEDQQLRKVIQLSKRQAEKSKQKEKVTNNRKISNDSIINQWANTYSSKQRNYTRIDYEKYKDIFQHVNSAWIQAQRAAERQQGVIQSQRLSKAVSESFSIKKAGNKKK